MGLIDEIGSQKDAIAAAAQLAKVRHYEIVDHTPDLPETSDLFGLGWLGRFTATTMLAATKNLPPGFYYRYLEPPQ
jgi:ClpP class serine protease